MRQAGPPAPATLRFASSSAVALALASVCALPCSPIADSKVGSRRGKPELERSGPKATDLLARRLRCHGACSFQQPALLGSLSLPAAALRCSAARWGLQLPLWRLLRCRLKQGHVSAGKLCAAPTERSFCAVSRVLRLRTARPRACGTQMSSSAKGQLRPKAAVSLSPFPAGSPQRMAGFLRHSRQRSHSRFGSKTETWCLA